MGGWNLPDDVSDNDPRAPWNDPGHCPHCCPCHEDSDWEPTCVQCEEGVDDGACWLYDVFPNRIANFLRSFKFMRGWNDDACDFSHEPDCRCDECDCGEPDDDPRDIDYWERRMD